ncbi:hypothetical protein ACX80O_02360 [Arthrobacter sp. Hz1]
MTTLRNKSPLGAIDLPLIGRTLEACEKFEVSEDLAKQLLEQPDVFARVAKPRTTKPRTGGAQTAKKEES